MIRQKLKLYAIKLLQFSAQTAGSPYNAINYRRQMFAKWAHFGTPCVFFTRIPLETRSPFCWKLCNADFRPQHYPNPIDSKLVMPNDFEMIKLVRANIVAQAIIV